MVSYFVRYRGASPSPAAFHAYYETRHADILKQFPKIRSLILHSSAAWTDPFAVRRGETMLLANSIASKPRGTLKTGKEAFYRQLEMPLAEAYAYASQVMTENMLDAEACEGIGAFLGKREPKWPA